MSKLQDLGYRVKASLLGAKTRVLCEEHWSRYVVHIKYGARSNSLCFLLLVIQKLSPVSASTSSARFLLELHCCRCEREVSGFVH